MTLGDVTLGDVTARAARLRFWARAPLLPLAAVLGARMRRRIPRLPEAAGARRFEVGTGRRHSLAVLGESTAVGVGVDQQTDGLALAVGSALALAHGLRVDLRIVGRSGASLREIREELAPNIEHAPDSVLVVTGVNDTLELTRGAAWSREIRALIRELQTRGTPSVLFSAVPPLGAITTLPLPARAVLGARAAYLDQLLAVACGDGGATHLRVGFPARDDLLAVDGFHPSAAGYAAWADALVAAWPPLRSTPR